MDTKLKEITWHAPEFKYRYKDISWYWLSFAVAGVLILLSLWQKNLLFIIFIIIAESMIIIWANRFPKELRFKLDKKGVYIDKINFYPYEELDGFHILENEDEDSDLILFGAPKICYKLNQDGQGVFLDLNIFKEISVDDIEDPYCKLISKIVINI